MMQVTKHYFPKTSNGNILDISTSIENFVMKMQVCENKYVKIINSTKKEYESKATTSAATVTQSHIFYLLLI